jgi:hypothetical protein
MKKTIYILLILFTAGLIFNSCEDDILDKTPLDEISDPDFWQTENDLQLYLNDLYPSVFSGWGGSGQAPSPDLGTDIVLESDLWYGSSSTTRLDGTTSIPASGGGWSWDDIRDVNYFLENADRAEDSNLKDQYMGEGYFIRAWNYFILLKKFGDLPIVKTVVNVDDEEILYSSRSSRTEVVDFIIEDLDQAISLMVYSAEAGASRLHKDVASLFKARVCLYEGTWEKYHAGTVFAGDTDGTDYLELAADAAKSVMDAGNYSLVTGDTDNAYYNLFVQTDYSSNSEVLFYKHYDYLTYGIQNSLWNQPNAQGMSQEMIKNYLCTDGLPYAVSELFGSDATLDVVEKNRDSRLNQSLITTGELDYISLSDDSVFYDIPYMVWDPTGLELKKWRTEWLDASLNNRTRDIGYIHFRYAEALLIYAEAKAELGTITQGDIDISVNLLRDRVGMPHLNMSSITTDPNWPDYGSSLTDIQYEIRRERVVELFGEGFRFDDLMRWRAHSLIVGKRFTGTYYTAEIEAEYPGLKVNDEGYLDPFRDILNTGYYGFNSGRDYLLPLPTNELTLNSNLEQNPGWE